MAADYEASSRFYGGRARAWNPRGCSTCEPVVPDTVEFDLEVRPRRVECFAFAGEGRRYAVAARKSECSRTHFSAMRNY